MHIVSPLVSIGLFSTPDIGQFFPPFCTKLIILCFNKILFLCPNNWRRILVNNVIKFKQIKTNKLRGLSPRANYTDGRRS